MSGLELVIAFEETQRKIERLAERIVRERASACKSTSAMGIPGGNSDDKMAANIAKLQELETRFHCNCAVYMKMRYEMAELLDNALAI